MTGRLTKSFFDSALNQTFLVRDAAPLQVQLIECSPIGPHAGELDREPFKLAFRGPLSPVMPQRIYLLENPEVGEVEIFLVPLGPDASGMKYEAVFN